MSGPSLRFIEVHAVDHCNNHCRWCNNHSPFYPDREYQAQDYFPALDGLAARGIGFQDLSIMGGEPFLHSNLTRFVLDLKERYGRFMGVTTNAFWLSEEELDRYAGLWKSLNLMYVSYYPNIVKDLGGAGRVAALLRRLKKTHPHLHVETREKYEFTVLEYPAEPLDVSRYCAAARCTCLLADGRLARCGPGAFARFRPGMPRAFLDSRDMFFDPADPRQDFLFWMNKYPLDACSHCTAHLGRTGPWKVEPGTRRRLDLELAARLAAARALFTMGNPGRAARALAEAVRLHPRSAEAFNDLGVVLHRLDRLPEARAALETSLALDPDSPETVRNLQALTDLAAMRGIRG